MANDLNMRYYYWYTVCYTVCNIFVPEEALKPQFEDVVSRVICKVSFKTHN